jgi:Tc toxin complex TcA C-terminal TcB-binding domain
MRSKFTSQQLYDWMVAQIAAVYFQSYQLAYDAAKRAQEGSSSSRAFRIAASSSRATGTA